MAQANQRTRTGLSVRPANRVTLGEISANLKSGPETQRPVKTQGFTIYEDSRFPNVGSVQDENAPNLQHQIQFPTYGRLSHAAPSGRERPEPPRVRESDFCPPTPTGPSYSTDSLLPFSIGENATTSKMSILDHMGSDRAAITKSFFNTSDSSTSSDQFIENLENLVPQISSYPKSEFEQNDESMLSSSPASEGNVSACDDEDSPMVVETNRNAGTDSFFDVDEYSLHILAHMKTVEVKYVPKWNYMTKQPDLTFSMRSILVDWLVEVAEEYRLQTETLFLAVNYIDRFLSFMSVQRSKLQLVGTACMFLAAKYEEIYPPDISEFCYITDDTYTKKQVLKMEQIILDVLDFECSTPTAHFFVNHFSKISSHPDDNEIKFLAQYLAELTLLDGETFLHFVPSVIAAASVALSRHTFGLPPWDVFMTEKTGYRLEDFTSCLVYLQDSFIKAEEYPQQAVREKYKNEKFNMVSKIKLI